MYKLAVGIAFGFLLFSTTAMAAPCTTYTLIQNNTPANADTVMANFNCAALTGGATMDSLTLTGATNFPGATTINGSGWVGIGTSSPSDILQVGDFSAGHLMMIGSSATGTNQIYFARTGVGAGRYQGYLGYNQTGNFMFFGTNQADRVFIDINGVVYPAADGTQNLGQSAKRWNTIYATNNVINTSDRRLKKNIADLNAGEGLSAVLKLRPVTFQWRQPLTDRATHYGFIAQDVQTVLPKVVDVGNDDRHTLGINYSAFIPSIVKAIQQLDQRIEGAKFTAGGQDDVRSLNSVLRRQQVKISQLETANSNALMEIGLLKSQLDALQRRVNLQTAQK